jgi:ubiquinone/menaquinone biosynthesis C-methylase UbiE
MRGDAKDAVRKQFGRQASWYTVSRIHSASDGLEALVRLASASPEDRALDVATGTGFTALALAPYCRRVVGVDFTPAMLREAASLRHARGMSNLILCLGDAEALPFRDGTFDIVTCRHAAHHFPDLPRALAEMVRVARPGGRVLIDDTCAPEDPALATLMNAWEQRRDRSHVANRPPTRLRRMLEEHGLRIDAVTKTEVPQVFSDWVRRSGMAPADAEELRRDFLAASTDARAAFRIRADGPQVLFSWDEVVIRGVKQ